MSSSLALPKAGKRLWVLLLAWVLLLLVGHQGYLQRAMPVAPYMDTLRVIALLEGWEDGKVSLAQLWGLGSSHQGLVNELFIYANVKTLGYDALWANRLTGGVIAIVSLLLGGAGVRWLWAASEGQPGLRWLGALFFCVLLPLQLFSGAGYEVLTLDLGLSLWVKNTLIVGYFLLHAGFLRKGAPTVRGLLLGLIGPLLVLMVTMGWGFAFVGAATLQVVVSSAFWEDKGWKRWQLFIPISTLWLAMLGYVGISFMGPGSGELAAAGKASVSDLLAMTAAALGSSVMSPALVARFELPLDWLVFVGAAMLFAGAVVLGLLLRRKKPLVDSIALALLAYGGATAAALAVGRSDSGVAGVIASRYYMDLVLFPIGLVWLWMMVLAPRSFLVGKLALAGSLLLLMVMQGFTALLEWRTAPYRAPIFQAMNEALLQMVPDDKAASLLQSPLNDARAASSVMQLEGLGPFHGRSVSACEASAVVRGTGWYGEENGGNWMSGDAVLQVPGCACLLRLEFFLPERFPERNVSIDGPDGLLTVVALQPGAGKSVEVALPQKPEMLKLHTEQTTQPLRSGLGEDQRELGAYVGPFSIACPVREQR